MISGNPGNQTLPPSGDPDPAVVKFLVLDGDTAILHALAEDDAKASAIRWAQGQVGRTVTVAMVVCTYRSAAQVIAVGDRESAATTQTVA